VQTDSLLYPMFAMVLLTFVTLLRLFVLRVRSVQSGTVSPSHFKTYQEGSEPEKALQLSRHFVNLFEAPTLFYVVCLAAMIANHATSLFVGLAWLYVAARVVHSVIHTGGNQIYPRIGAYFASWFVLLAMWGTLLLAVRGASS